VGALCCGSCDHSTSLVLCLYTNTRNLFFYKLKTTLLFISDIVSILSLSLSLSPFPFSQSVPSAPFRSTYASAYISILFVSIICVRAALLACFVIALAGFDSLVIHTISVISRLSYDCRIAMMSIIRRFLYVVPSFTRHLYKENELMQIVIRVWVCVILSRVSFSAQVVLNLCASAYSSDAITLLVTRLHLTLDQWMILQLLSLSARTMI